MGYYETRKAVSNELLSFIKKHNGEDITAEMWRPIKTRCVLVHGSSKKLILKILAEAGFTETADGGLENA